MLGDFIKNCKDSYLNLKGAAGNNGNADIERAINFYQEIVTLYSRGIIIDKRENEEGRE